MSELRDMVAIYGAIDQRLVESPERRNDVAELIPQCSQGAPRWYEDLVQWTRRERVRDEGEPFPSLQEALEDLGPATLDDGSYARRLHAISALVRADPDLLNHEVLAEPARQALRGAEQEPQEDVLELLLDPALDRRGTQLEDVGAPPCVATLVPSPFGPAASLEASFVTDTLTFEEACGFLNPENWPKASAFWCEIRHVAFLSETSRRYNETVSVDCRRRDETWTVSTDLDFTWDLEDLEHGFAGTQYRLPPGYPLEGGVVQVDEGSLTVQAVPEGVRVHATKRVRFKGPFEGAAISLVTCALGFGAALEDLVFGAKGGPLPSSKAGPVPTAGDGDSLVDQMIARAATCAKSSIDTCGRAATATADRFETMAAARGRRR